MTKLDEKQVVDARFTAGSTTAGNLPPPVSVELAFAGRSNVGKSSLLNALTGRRNLVRTSSTPGCTRQISLFDVRCRDNAALTLVDLPGYGYAKRSKVERRAWDELITQYLLERPTLAVLVLLFDARRGLEVEEHELVDMMRAPSRVARRAVELVLVATKTDKLPSASRKPILAQINKDLGTRAYGVSIREPATIPPLWAALRRAAGTVAVPEPAEPGPSEQPVAERSGD